MSSYKDIPFITNCSENVILKLKKSHTDIFLEVQNIKKLQIFNILQLTNNY